MTPSLPGTDHILILAAGRGTRAGGPKALHLVGSELWWIVQARRLARTGMPVRWVVSEAVEEAMKGHTGSRIPADDAAPMFASILSGVESINSEALHGARNPQAVRGVFILPVDVPAPQPSTFRQLSEAMSSAPPKMNAAIPTHDGKHGHPVYLPWRFVQQNLLGRPQAPDDRLDRMIGTARLEVPVDDPGVLLNLNTAADFEALSTRKWGL